MPAYTTIITSIEESSVDSCREFIRQHVDPACTASGPQCSQQFRFDLIPTLHFCSFCILDKQDEFDAYLVFEATFDGSREDFLSDLLRLAPDGMHKLYRHCVGYPASGLDIPHIAREYLERHDAGAHTFFSGSPGRSAVQIQDEQRLRTAIVNHLSTVMRSRAPRLSGLFEEVRSFVRSKTNHRWAEQPPPVPWEVKFRSAIVVAAFISVLLLASGFGVSSTAVLAALLGLGPLSMHDSIMALLSSANHFGSTLTAELAVLRNPWLDVALQTAVPLVALIFVWLLLRLGELILGGLNKQPRDQVFMSRVPLHILVILRYWTLLLIAGATALTLLTRAPPVSAGFSALVISLTLLVAGLVALLVLHHSATTLKLSVQLTKLKPRQEAWRRLRLDLVNFGRAILIAFGILVIARYLPLTLDSNLAKIGVILVQAALVVGTYAAFGLLAAYLIGLILFLVIRTKELQDKRKLGDAGGLIARARVNAAKYAREESGNNALQNHLASLTRVKPGLFRICLLRATLFVIGLLSRFWFNRGELGGIPTILSARWVLIDRGRRLLFLDNYGGAWESYLNQFIDMEAVKGLNAIWSNTFVKVHGRAYGFPETRFLFWRGAQAERPFKAYVRESQIETLAWYSAYPTLSVVTINTNSQLRRSLGKSPSAPEIDTVFQHL